MTKKTGRIAALMMGAVLVLGTCEWSPERIQASSVTDLQQQQSRLESAKAAAEQEASELKAAKAQLQSQLGDMNSDLYDLSGRISDLADDISATQQDIEETREELAVEEKLADEQYQNMKLRIQFAYENSMGNSYLEAFLGADNFVDLLNRVAYVSELSGYDRSQMDAYEEVVTSIRENQDHLQTQMASLESQQEDLQAEEDQLLAAIADKQDQLEDTSSSLDSVEAQNAAREEKLASLADQISAMKAYEEVLEAQQEKAEAAKSASSSSKSSSSGSSTKSSSSASSSTKSSSTGSSSSKSSSSATSSAGEAELFAALVYCEAGGESYEGQLAVASVVMNRVHSSSFPNTITGVIYESGQFSPASSGRLAVALSNNLATASCRKAVSEAMAGNTNGDWLYFRRAGGHSGDVIGNQVFY